MGVEKIRRPLLMMQGFETTASSTVADTLTVSGALTASGGLTLTGMTAGEYLTEYVQTLNDYAALTDTGGSSKAGYQPILGYGITAITVTGTSGTTAGSTANDLVFKLNPPIAAGVHKRIYVTGTSASTKVVSIRTATSTHTFFGSTRNAIAFTTTVNNLGHGWSIHLDGLSATQWALTGLPGIPSTAAAIAGATA